MPTYDIRQVYSVLSDKMNTEGLPPYDKFVHLMETSKAAREEAFRLYKEYDKNADRKVFHYYMRQGAMEHKAKLKQKEMEAFKEKGEIRRLAKETSRQERGYFSPSLGTSIATEVKPPTERDIANARAALRAIEWVGHPLQAEPAKNVKEELVNVGKGLVNLPMAIGTFAYRAPLEYPLRAFVETGGKSPFKFLWQLGKDVAHLPIDIGKALGYGLGVPQNEEEMKRMEKETGIPLGAISDMLEGNPQTWPAAAMALVKSGGLGKLPAAVWENMKRHWLTDPVLAAAPAAGYVLGKAGMKKAAKMAEEDKSAMEQAITESVAGDRILSELERSRGETEAVKKQVKDTYVAVANEMAKRLTGDNVRQVAEDLAKNVVKKVVFRRSIYKDWMSQRGKALGALKRIKNARKVIERINAEILPKPEHPKAPFSEEESILLRAAVKKDAKTKYAVWKELRDGIGKIDKKLFEELDKKLFTNTRRKRFLERVEKYEAGNKRVKMPEPILREGINLYDLNSIFDEVVKERRGKAKGIIENPPKFEDYAADIKVGEVSADLVEEMLGKAMKMEAEGIKNEVAKTIETSLENKGAEKVVEKPDGEVAIKMEEGGKSYESPDDVPPSEVIEVDNLLNEAIKKTSEISSPVYSLWEKLMHAFFDPNYVIRKAANAKEGDVALLRRAVRRLDLSRSATMQAHEWLSDWEPRIYGGLSKKEMEILNKMITSKRFATVGKYKKGHLLPGGKAPEVYEAEFNALAKRYPNLAERAKVFLSATREILDMLHKEELIDDGVYEYLKDKPYARIQYVSKYVDKEYQFKIGWRGKTVVSTASGLDLLKEGSTDLPYMDTRELLRDYAVRSFRLSMRNKANIDLARFAATHPDNPLGIRLAKIIGMKKNKETGFSEPIFERIDSSHVLIFARKRGKKIGIILPNRLAYEWIVGTGIMESTALKALSWISGSRIFKATATGYNPDFAVRNFPRDTFYIWLRNEDAYSPLLPVFIWQFSKDAAEIVKEWATNKQTLRTFKDVGGMMNLLTLQGKFFENNPRIMKTLDAAASIGEASEMLPRLALTKRYLKTGRDPVDAVWGGRSYLDFAISGSWARAIDAVLPYFNVRTQVLRGYAESFKRNPSLFLFKMIQAGLVSAATAYTYSKHLPGETSKFSDRVRRNYILIPTEFTITNEDGVEERYFLQIPVDQGFTGIHAMMTELGEALGEGRPIDWERFRDGALSVITDMTYGGVSSYMPPSLKMLIAFSLNYDVDTGNEIFQYSTSMSRQEDLMKLVSENPVAYLLYKLLGDKAAVVGVRGLEKLIASNNLYLYVMGGVINEVLDFARMKLDPDVYVHIKKNIGQRVSDLFVGTFYRRASDVEKDIRELSKRKKEYKKEIYEKKKRFNRLLVKIFNGYYTDDDIKEFKKLIGSVNDRDSRNNLRKAIQILKLKDLPAERRGWWFLMRSLPIDLAADLVAEKLTSRYTSKETKEAILKELSTVRKVSLQFAISLARALKKRGVEVSIKGSLAH